jgi:hypothetical protein
LSLAKASCCVKSGEVKMEVQGAYFRGCYVALTADCGRGARRSVSQNQLIICKSLCIYFFREGVVPFPRVRTGKCLTGCISNRTSCVHCGIPLDSIVRF